MRHRSLIAAGALALAVLAPTAAAATFTHGVAAGDMTVDGALLWTRIDAAETVTAEVATDAAFSNVVFSAQLQARPANDFTTRFLASGLEGQGNTFFYRFLLADGTTSEVGTFRTPPPADEAADLRFVYTGDSDAFIDPLSGEYFFNEFEVLDAAAAENPDFWLYFGDTIYGDSEAGELFGVPKAETVDQYHDKYKANRELPALRNIYANYGTYVHWDDHEIVNDFDGQTVDIPQARAGLQAFLDYQPIAVQPGRGARLYRTFRWGRDAEFFIADQRMFRAADVEDQCLIGGVVADTLPTLGGPEVPLEVRLLRTALKLPVDTDPACLDAINDPTRDYLGASQLNQLKADLLASDATFKFIVNQVPAQELFLLPYDRWEGYAAARQDLLEFIIAADVENVIFLTTDTHAAIAGDVRPGLFTNPTVAAKEVIAGPIATFTIYQEIEALGFDPFEVLVLIGAIAPPDCANLLDPAGGITASYALVELDSAAQTVTITVKDDTGTPLLDSLAFGECSITIQAGDLPALP